MAESIISPGVFTRENDLSFIQPAPVAVGAAFIGPTVKGPVEMPTVVTSYNDYVRKFGVTFASGSDKFEYLTSLAVKNYFSQGGNTALITRVVDNYGALYSEATSTNIASNKVTGANRATGSGTLVNPIASNQEFKIQYGSTAYRFIPTSLTPLPEDNGAGNLWFFESGSAIATTVTNLAAQINSAIPTVLQATGSGANLILSGSALGTSRNGIQFLTGSITNSAQSSSLFTIQGGTDVAASSFPFSISTLGKGVIYNNSTAATDAGVQNSDGSLVSGSEDNLRWEITNVSNSRGTFTLSVRRGDDSTNTKTILETFNNLSLDPASDDYIEKRIGSQYTQVGSDGTTKYLQLLGDYPNRSNYIRVSNVNLPTLNYLGNDGVSVNLDAAGVSYSASLPQAVSGAFHGAGGEIIGGAKFFSDIDAQTQGLIATDYTVNAIPLLENKDDYQFNVIVAPGITAQDHPTVADALISLAENRGDCIAVIDLVGYQAELSQVTEKAAVLNSSYAASYWPWLQTRSATGKNEWIPASTVIPGVYTFTDAASAPWFAPAGLVRGGIPGVIQAERRLTKGERDSLYSGKVNPIASFPGTGISVFGQKTLQTKASALDRVNVRRLLIELKKFIGDQAKNLVFEQNTIATRNKFLATVNPYLESVVQRQGLYAYRVVMDESNNSADVVDRNQLIGQIYIQPAKTIEFVVLDFTIEPTGATFV